MDIVYSFVKTQPTLWPQASINKTHCIHQANPPASALVLGWQCYFYKMVIYLFSLCAYIRECAVPWSAGGGPGIAFGSQFPPSTMWLLEINSDFGNKSPYPLKHLTSPKDILVHVDTLTASFLYYSSYYFLESGFLTELGARLPVSKLQ